MVAMSENTVSMPIWMGLDWDGVSTAIPKFKEGTIDHAISEHVKKTYLDSVTDVLIESCRIKRNAFTDKLMFSRVRCSDE